MKPYETLKLNKEFRRLYGRGKNLVHPVLVTYALKNRSGNIRMGITAGKKVGGAVERNRAKRVITAAFRQCVPFICEGYDLVFIARTRTGAAGSDAVRLAMEKHFKELGIWSKDNEKTSTTSD